LAKGPTVLRDHCASTIRRPVFKHRGFHFVDVYFVLYNYHEQIHPRDPFIFHWKLMVFICSGGSSKLHRPGSQTWYQRRRHLGWQSAEQDCRVMFTSHKSSLSLVHNDVDLGM